MSTISLTMNTFTGTFDYLPNILVLAAPDDADDALKITVTLADVLGFLFAPFLVLITGLITKASTSSGVKAVLLLFLSSVDGFVVEYIAGPDSFNFWVALLKALGIFMAAVNLHFGFLRPTGISTAVNMNMGNTDAKPSPAR